MAVSVTFPLLFVRGRARELPLLAVGALVVQVPVEWGMREAFGLAGIAAGMAITTGARAGGAALVARLARRGRCAACSSRRSSAAGSRRSRSSRRAPCSAPSSAAAVGLVLYAAALLAWRPAGLRAAWSYARTLQ